MSEIKPLACYGWVPAVTQPSHPLGGDATDRNHDEIPTGALPVAVIAHNYFGHAHKRTMVRPFGSPFGFAPGLRHWHYPAAIAPQDAYLFRREATR